MKKKILAFVLTLAMMMGVFGAFVGCSNDVEAKTFRIVALKGGRGETYVQKLVDEFKKDAAYKDITFQVNLFSGETIGSEITNMLNSGKNIDLLGVNLNTKSKVIEGFVKDKQLADISDVLNMKAPGETKAVKDKLVGGILNNFTCRPYGGGKTYLMPSFYSPTGLFYDASRFGTGKYTLPTTMAEFFALGDQLNAARAATPATPYLFTYPTAGYFDSVVYPLIASYAGIEKYEKCLAYADGIWEDAAVKEGLRQIVKLNKYITPTTAGNANGDNFTKNQQQVIGKADGSAKGEALFIPNGDWLPGEMSKTTPAGFKWGFTSYPKKDATATAYTNSFIETWEVHKDSDNQDIAKKFLAFYYGDAAAKIVAKECPAIIPTKDALTNAKANGIKDDTINMYNLYNTADVVVGNFVATTPVPDLNWGKILFDESIQAIMTNEGNKTEDVLLNEWAAKLEAASDKQRAAIIK